jgi:processive 1,2-diacylglycerol beta-glucosyltransferase
MAPSRILVLSASVGAGHLRAAEAVELALRQTVPDATVQNLDVLTLTNAAFRRLYSKAYLDLVNKAPQVLGIFYDMLDRPSLHGQKRSDQLRLLVEQFNLKRFTRLLEKGGPWDLVINTHFLPAEILASLRRAGRVTIPQVTVTTDFETHRLWVNQPCDLYCTATEEGALYLQSCGVPAHATVPTGIPIHPVFAEPKDRAVCLKRQKLRGDRPVILQMAGGFGVGPVEQLLRAILAIDRPLEVVVVAGRNPELKAHLDTAPSGRHRLRVLGFTTEVDELMTCADLVVSKPGGLTTSEALARGAGMVIVNPTPGQESRNSDFLLENGAGIKANHLATLPFKVGELLASPERLARLRASARSLARPRAAFEVVERALKLIPQVAGPCLAAAAP